MKNIFKWLFGVIILLLGGASTYKAYNKSKEAKKLKKIINENKKKEQLLEKDLTVLGLDIVRNKRAITSLKRKLTMLKVKTKQMENVYDTDNVEDARKFLKQVGKG